MASGEQYSSRLLAQLVKRSLADGRRVEVERLGTFRPVPGGGFKFEPERKPTVFLAYAAEDEPKVSVLYQRLEAAGLRPWMDCRKLLPGQNWPRAIEGAIETADFFVACLSRRSITKRGTFQSELRYALDCARRAPLDDIFFIPARLENCRVPPRITSQFQYIDLFPDIESGARRLAQFIRKELRRRSAQSRG